MRGGGGGGEQLVAASWSDGKTEHVFISKIAGHPLGAGQFAGMEYVLVVSMKLKFWRKNKNTISTVSAGFGAIFLLLQSICVRVAGIKECMSYDVLVSCIIITNARSKYIYLIIDIIVQTFKLSFLQLVRCPMSPWFILHLLTVPAVFFLPVIIQRLSLFRLYTAKCLFLLLFLLTVPIPSSALLIVSLL